MCSKRVRRGPQVTRAAVTSWPLTPQIMVTLTFTHLYNRTEISSHIALHCMPSRLHMQCLSLTWASLVTVTVVVIRIISCAVCTSGPGDIQHLTLTLDVSIKTWQLEHIIVILFKCNITLKSNKMRTRHETKPHCKARAAAEVTPTSPPLALWIAHLQTHLLPP